MADPSVTNTFVDATIASASEVNQNFSDIANAISDGTKHVTISSSTANNKLAGADITTTGLSVGGTCTIGTGQIYGTMSVAGTMTVSGSVNCASSVVVSSDLKVLGAFGGEKCVIDIGWCSPSFSNTYSPDLWLGGFGTDEYESALVMLRSGCVRSYQMAFVPRTKSYSNVVYATCIMKNEATQTVCTNVAFVTDATATTNIYGSFARDAFTFQAGDRIGVKMVEVTSAVLGCETEAGVYFEVQYNT